MRETLGDRFISLGDRFISIDSDHEIFERDDSELPIGELQMSDVYTSDQTCDQTFSGQDARTIYGKAPTEFGDATEIVFPDDPTVILNVQEFGAIGDGLTDDTVAIQRAIYEASASNRVLYFPNGTYRITQELRFAQEDGRALRAGPHLYGQSRDGVILKLDDNLPEFANPDTPTKAVIRTVNAEDGATWRDISADFFNRQIVNFTIDTGNNPGAVGIKFYSNNTGLLQNVRVIGNGAIGVDVASIALNGPYLMQNIEVDGFNIGVHAGNDNSATISNLVIRNASTYGLYHNSGNLQVEGLVIENAPVAVFTSPTARFGRTTLTLINGQFSGSESSQPAIISGDILFARNIETTGYRKAIEATAGTAGNVESSFIDEYSSHGVSEEFTTNVDRSLNLPIRYMPMTYDTNPQNWVSVQAYGAIPGDNIDDTQAIQDAIDAAAAAQQTTVYFPGDASFDPNWYTLNDNVNIHGSVQHIIGFAPTRILGNGGFRVIDDTEGADKVQFQGFNFTKISYENASSRTMVLQNLTGSVKVTGPGETYLNSISGQLSIEHPDATVWARQLNTESPNDLNVLNNGGTLWVLGQKTEGGGLKAQILNGAKTEILGAYIYSVSNGQFDTVYEVVDADASFAGIRERTSTAKYSNFVREIRDGEPLIFEEDELPTGNRFNRGVSLYSASTLALESEPLTPDIGIPYIIEDEELGESLHRLKPHLEKLGVQTLIQDDYINQAVTEIYKDLTLTFEPVLSAGGNADFSDIASPILSLAHQLYDDLQIAHKINVAIDQAQIDVLDKLTDSLLGITGVYTTPINMEWEQHNNEDVTIPAPLPEQSNQSIIFNDDSSDLTIDPSSLAGTIGFFPPRLNPEKSQLTVAGPQLFDTTIDSILQGASEASSL